MKKVTSIFLLIFYICTQFFLPKGNFAYIEQIPVLYADFCRVNNTKDVFEFLKEQFFELGFDDDETDEPFEKEAKPVPFHAPSIQTFVAFPGSESAGFIALETINPHSFIYILKEHWVHASSIYHPPKNKLA